LIQIQIEIEQNSIKSHMRLQEHSKSFSKGQTQESTNVKEEV